MRNTFEVYMSSDRRRERKRLASQAVDLTQFEQFYKQYYRFLKSNALKSCHDAPTAELLTHEAFARASRAFHRFDHQYPKAWLKQILRNVVIDYYNKKKREQALFAQTDFDLVEKIHQHEESQQQDVKDYEILEKVIKNQGNKEQVEQSKALFDTWGQKYLPADMKASLEALSEAHRNIILAREVLGYNYSDISVTFEIKEGTVMSRLSRARKALKDQLDEYKSNQ